MIVGGAALGGAVLVAQLIGYLGWDGLLTDVRLTFQTRNVAAADLRAFRSEVWSFVEEHQLVFWDNCLGTGFGGYSDIFRWCLLPYTPALVFVTLLISTAWALSSLPVLELVLASRGSRRTWSARSVIPWGTGAAGLFVCATTMDVSFAGLSAGGRRLGSVGAVAAGAAGTAVGALGLAIYRR